jgi:hypothetical protein
MPKKTTHGKSEKGRPITAESAPAEPSPPLLSEKLIAQLQQAVGLAQRRRMPGDVAERNSTDNEF